MPINRPPQYIDDARVLLATEITDEHYPTGFTRHYVNGQLMETPQALAICQYDDDPGYYLFYCNAHWNVMNDTYHDSQQRAIGQAELEFMGTKATWKAVGD